MDELIYTSVPEGLATGARGYCTVAQTRNTSRSLVGKLESLCNYKHVFAPGDPNEHLNPINFQFVRFRDAGKAKYVLSRIGNAGFDYTQRTNFLAHNIALDRASLPKAGPVWFMNQHASFATQWDENRQPEYLAERQIAGDAQISPAICEYWKSVTGDSGYGGWLAENLLDQKIPEVVVAYSLNSDILKLLEETFKLIPEASRWKCTFSTYSESANAAYDCKLRCVLVGSPAATKASQSTKIAFLDLSKPFELRASTFVDLARTGVQQSTSTIEAEPQKRAVEPEPELVDAVTFVDSSPKSKLEKSETTVSKETQRWREIEEEDDWQDIVTSSSVSPLKKLVVALAASIVVAAGLVIAINKNTAPVAITSNTLPTSEPRSDKDNDSKNSEPKQNPNARAENRKTEKVEATGDIKKPRAPAPPKDKPGTTTDLKDQLARINKACTEFESFKSRGVPYDYIDDIASLTEAALKRDDSTEVRAAIKNMIKNPAFTDPLFAALKKKFDDLSTVTIKEGEFIAKRIPTVLSQFDFYNSLESKSGKLITTVIEDIQREFPVEKFVQHVTGLQKHQELLGKVPRKPFNEPVNQKIVQQIEDATKSLKKALEEFEVKDKFNNNRNVDIPKLFRQEFMAGVTSGILSGDKSDKYLKHVEALLNQNKSGIGPFQTTALPAPGSVLPENLLFFAREGGESPLELSQKLHWSPSKQLEFSKRFYSFDDKTGTVEDTSNKDFEWTYCYLRNRLLVKYNNRLGKFILKNGVYCSEFAIEETGATIEFQFAGPQSRNSVKQKGLGITLHNTNKQLTQKAQNAVVELVYINPFKDSEDYKYPITFSARENASKILNAVPLVSSSTKERVTLRPGTKIKLHYSINGVASNHDLVFSPEKQKVATDSTMDREVEVLDLSICDKFPSSLIYDNGALYLLAKDDLPEKKSWSAELSFKDVQRLASHYFARDSSVFNSFNMSTFKGSQNATPFKAAFVKDVEFGKIPAIMEELRQNDFRDLQTAFENSLGITVEDSFCTGQMVVSDGYIKAFELGKGKIKEDITTAIMSRKLNSVDYAALFVTNGKYFWGSYAPEAYKKFRMALLKIKETHDAKIIRFVYAKPGKERIVIPVAGPKLGALVQKFNGGTFTTDELRAYTGDQPLFKEARDAVKKQYAIWISAYTKELNAAIVKIKKEYLGVVIGNFEKRHKLDPIKMANKKAAGDYAGNIMEKLEFVNKFHISIGNQNTQYKLKY